MDPVGYKGPLRAILLVANFDAVAAVQHLLGLAMAVVIYLVLLRRGVPRWLAALAIAPVLLDAYQLQIEQTVMPDVWFEALIVAGLAILLWQPQARLAARRGGRHRAGHLGHRRPGRRGPDPARGDLPARPRAAAGGGPSARRPPCARPSPCRSWPTAPSPTCSAGDFFLSHTGVTSFYGRMAAAADCATLRLPAAERGMCPTTAQQAMGPGLAGVQPGSPIRPYYDNLPRAETDSLISDFNHRVLTQQPQRVLARLRPRRGEAVRADPHDQPGRHADLPLAVPDDVPVLPAARLGAGRRRPRSPGSAAARPRSGGPVAGFLRAYQLGGGYTPGPLLALCMLAGLAGSAALLRRRWRADPATRQLALACLLFFTSAASVLLVSDLFEFSWRYQLPALVTLVPAGALGIAVLARLVRTRAVPP